jgi:hypothetical protein
VLIETYENKSGSLVFSKNKFDFLTNFVHVSKSEPDVTRMLDFKEIGNFINKPVKKNLIVYRLLTNDEDLDPYSSKLGFFLKVKEKVEIVYFDPIFILKDIEHLKITIPMDEFVFKIQQVGFRTDSIIDDTVIFKEHFAIDMSEEEAENQNDSIFAETMLSVTNKNQVELMQDENRKKVFDSIKHTRNISNNKFYNLEKSESSSLNQPPKRETKLVEVKGDRDFFQRVASKKNRAKEYDSSTLKMFR